MLDEFAHSRFWSLKTAVLWIAFRDAAKAGAEKLAAHPRKEITAAESALITALEAGDVVASALTPIAVPYFITQRGSLGTPQETRHSFQAERVNIPAIEWIDLRLFSEESVASVPGGKTYTDVRLKQDDVIRHWPSRANLGRRELRRGPKSDRTMQIAARMLDDLRRGDDLLDQKQEALSLRYGAARSTCVKALGIALSKFQKVK